MRIAALAALLSVGLAQDKPSGGNPIDAIIGAKWTELKIQPNRLSSDEEFLRRVTLDLVGTIPGPEEALAFARSTESKKREKKIDELLASEDWAEFWAERLAAILLSLRDRRRGAANDELKGYLQAKLSNGTRYDALVEELITAKGTNKDGDPTDAFVFSYLYKDKTQKKDLAVQISKVFMGIQLQCAQCHDHPFERWTKDDFYSVVANFAGTSLKTVDKGDPKSQRDDVFEIVDRPMRRGYRPEGYKVEVKPKFLDGSPVAGDSTREAFAKRLVSAENPQFARATVNRIWSLFTGQGFVEPVDDFSVKNPARLPELLDALTRGFIDSGFDLKWLMRTIATSKVYQLSSRRKEGEFPDEARAYYAFALVRPMTPEQLFGALLAAQGFGDVGEGRGNKIGRAREQFMRQAEAPESPGKYTSSLQQVMRMLNVDSPLYQGTKARGRGRMAEILRDKKRPEDVFQELYLATVSRLPAREELERCLAYYKEHGSAASAYEDIFFVLLNTNEFFFNH